MKKITLLLFTFLIYTIASGQSGRYYRLRALGTSIDSSEKNTFCSGGNLSNKPLARANITSITPLTQGKIYRINYDDELKYYWIEQTNSFPSEDTEIYVNENNVTLANISCPDSDNDGVTNSTDNCPNVAGPPSNNGCPLPTGNPDLKVDLTNSLAFSACQSCLPWLNTFLNSGKRHLIAGGVGSLSFNKLKIKNAGNSPSNASSVDFYWSKNNTLTKTGTSADKFLKSVSIPSRNPNSSYDIQTSLVGWDIFSCTSCGSNNGNSYIIAEIDPSNTNQETTTGETNNLLIIPITYNTSATATSLKVSVSDLNVSAKKEVKYSIDIFNFSGQKMITKEVYNIEEENATSLALPKGIYIIKSKKGDRKIYVN